MFRTLALAPLLLGAALAQDAPRGGRIAWERDFVRALGAAGSAGSPQMLYFTHDG